jgi:TolC family type I secretion outer membrane protein
VAASAVALAPLPATAEGLIDALTQAYATNPTLSAARARLRATNEAVPQELSNWRPTVELNGSGGTQRIHSETATTDSTSTTRPLTASLEVRQPLYRGGRTVAGVERAENEVRAERARLGSIEQQVLLSAVTAYMDVWRDQAILQLNFNNEEVLRRQLEASQDRFQVGEITRTDVAQSESRVAGATAARVGAEGSLRASRAVFEEVVGMAPPAELAPPTRLDGLPVSLAASVERARAENPDVLAADFAQRAAERNVRQTEGELYPEVFLSGSLAHSEETTADDNETDRAQLLAQVRVPLYQAGFVSSRVRASKQQNSQRRLELEEARRRAEREAVAAWETLVAARARITSLESQVSTSEIALEGVRQENLVGARTVLDVLDAEQELLNAQVSLVGVQRDEVVASFQLLTAVGRLTAEELNLEVEIYQPTDDYHAVRDSWFGLSAPGE